MTTDVSLSRQPSLSEIFSVFNQLSEGTRKGWHGNCRGEVACGSEVIDDIYITNVITNARISIVLNCTPLPPSDTTINHRHGANREIFILFF